MARNYIPSWDRIGISKDRYVELLRFCRQYRQWELEAESMLGVRGKALDGMPHGNGLGDPVAAAAGRRERLLRKMQLVEDCAMRVGGGKWFIALIHNVCDKMSYYEINPDMMPSLHKQDFYKARKEFFILLNEAVDERW